MIRAHSEQTSSLRNMLNSILSPIRSIVLRIPKHLISTKSINTNMAKQVIDEAKFTGVRLPKNIKPIHYDLSLKPNFEDFTFTGKVKIDFEGQELSDSVVVHANELKIIDGHVENGDQRNPLEVVTYSPGTETATLTFRDSLTPLGSISINFTGILNDRMKGFYKTAFKIGETEVYAATTQFESTDARRCFPCWDEPAVKATFSVSMTIEKFMNVDGKQFERIVLSNMPETSRTDLGAELEVKFEKSPIMSTYLLAFIVGPFDVLEGTDGHRPIRVFTTPGKKEQGRFALEVTCKALPYYEDYFDIKYPLPKMDLVAIPDFMSGAMENWGLVTYRETCLLFDPATTSTDRKQYIAIVVAHELAHQWFGNLVTMEWWTHLWLNEGFASFMEYLCADHIFPEYDLWSQFVTDQYCTAMSLDALHNSHPIEVPVIHASEIDEIFDTISYSKGASVIRMLYTYIGDDNFRKGMKDYLTKFAYKNTETEDLWLCLEAASNKPVRKLMSGWTSQRGYPWLSVDYAKKGDKVKLTLTQNKFSANGALNEEDAASSWVVPISIVTGDQPNGPREICLLEGKTAEVTIDNVGDDWIKLNPGTIGLYSVRYPVEMTTKLYPAISDQTLSPMDRLNLQRDFYAFCQAGIVSSTELLQLLQAYKTETNYTVWSSIDDCIGHFKLILSDTCCAPKFQTFGCQLYNEIYQKLGWAVKEGESHTTAMLRALVIRRLVSLQDEDVTKEAMRLYKVQLEGGPQVAADLRAAVYQAASVHGDEATFSSLFDIYRKADMSEEQNRALRALGSTKDEARLQRVLDFCLSSEVRKQDKVFVIVPAAANNPKVTWKFFKDNAAFFQKEFGTCHLMTSMAKSVSQNFVSEEMAVEVGEFFEKNKFPGTERSIKQAMEKVRLNTAWLHRDREAIKAFLSSY